MQISVHRSNKNFVRSVRITPFHLTRTGDASFLSSAPHYNTIIQIHYYIGLPILALP